MANDQKKAQLFHKTQSKPAFYDFMALTLFDRICHQQNSPDVVRAEILGRDGGREPVPEVPDRQHGQEREDPDLQLQSEHDHGPQDRRVQGGQEHHRVLPGER